jgi:hypothetical protein
MNRPTLKDANRIKFFAQQNGYNEDQLARYIGVSREVMRSWAKTNKKFAEALDDALRMSREFWDSVDEENGKPPPKPAKRKPPAKRKAPTKEQLAEREQDDAAWRNAGA